MKFFNLLKKELGELLTVQTILSLVIVSGMLMMVGNLMKSTIKEAVENEYTITLSDRDNTDFTKQLAKALEESGATLKMVDSAGDDYSAILKDADTEALVIIPEGFTEKLENDERPEIISIAAMKSAAAMSNIMNSNSGAIGLISDCISSTFAAKAGLTAEQVELMQSPVTVTEQTIVKDKSAPVGATSVMSSIMTKNMILPVVVFILIMFTSNMLIGAISNEKIDKTLETLLSAPVSRTAILGAKMLAAAIIALLNAVVYMFGFSSFMTGATENVSEEMSGQLVGQYISVGDALERLGLTLGVTDYVLIGAQLFLTIMICLSISLMLGALVNDSKQSQTMIMPLMIMAMVPYIISMMADINTLPMALRVVVYAIPFTHTFSAMNNLMFGNTAIFFGGLAYQFVVFVICLFFALKLFNSDKILTASLNFGQKSKFKKHSNADE
ncbi:MAG: ABC transporter permease [Ruminococcus sp.]|nr:ABC transporter permease [Ruminococcus sp.]